MSTEETGGEEEEKGESSIALSSLGTVDSIGTRLRIGLPIVTPGLPIGNILIPAIVTTTKVKDIDFDNYDTDIMSSDSYIKSIPTIKAGITAAEFAVKEVAL
jgi:hypothetical protein